MTKELIERIAMAREHMRLHGELLPSLWTYQGFAINVGELFSAIEALQARVVELESDNATYKDAIKDAAGSFDTLKAELAAIKNQEPVAWALRRGGHGEMLPDVIDPVEHAREPGWYSIPLYAAPVPQLRGVSDAQGLPSVAAPAQTTGESSGHPTPPVREPLTDEQIDTVTYKQFGTQLEAQHKVHRAFARAIEAAIKEQAK